MRELIGSCIKCGKDVYCLDGFLNGIYIGNQLICFECAEEAEEELE